MIDHASDDRLDVRAGPSADYEAVGSLPYDATGVIATGVAALDSGEREWVQVSHGDLSGWVAGWLLSPSLCWMDEPGQSCVTDTVCTDWLNVRAGPGAQFDVIGWLAYDAVGVVGTGASSLDDRERPWVQIRYGSGVGWVAGWFVDPAPCTASSGAPCMCPSDPWVQGFVHRVDPVNRVIWFDPFEGHYWEEGWADSEGFPINDDPTVLWLRVAGPAVVIGCSDPEAPSCAVGDGGPTVEYDLGTLASWVRSDTAVWQSDHWARRNQDQHLPPEHRVANATNQWWEIVLDGCTVVEIAVTYTP